MSAVVLAGLAVSVMAESSVRAEMRALGPAEGYPALPSCKVGLLRARGSAAAPAEALAGHVVASLTNLAGFEPSEGRSAA